MARVHHSAMKKRAMQCKWNANAFFPNFQKQFNPFSFLSVFIYFFFMIILLDYNERSHKITRTLSRPARVVAVACSPTLANHTSASTLVVQ